MQGQNQNYPDSAVYFLTRLASDGHNAVSVLGKAGIRAEVCGSIEELCDRASDGAGVFIISEETLDESSRARLLEFLVRQPAWSDIPIILLTGMGEIRHKTYILLDFLGKRANVTLLEKPLRTFTLTSVTQAALRSRERQYEVRTLLQNYSRAYDEAQTATAKFRAVFEQSSVFAGIMTLGGTFTEANRLCLEVCGYREEEVLGKLFWECAWWRGSKEVQEKIRAGTMQAARGETYKETLPYLWADGSKRVVEFALYPIRDETGQVIFLHPTGVDITERQQATARSEFLSQLTQKLSMVSDLEAINKLATREIGRFLGAQRCYFFEPQSDGNEARVLPDWQSGNKASLAGNFRLKDLGAAELWQHARSAAVMVDDVGKNPWTKESLLKYRDWNIMAFNQAPFIHEGKWVACIAVTSDARRHWTADEQSLLENAIARVWPLIERARVEATLRAANALLADKASHLESLVQQRTSKLQETVGELEAFSYSIAHDMRAPLRSLQGFAKVLLTDYENNLDADGQRYLQRIARAADRMDKLIRDVLDYSQLLRADFAVEKVDVGQLLRSIMDIYPMLAPDTADVTLEGPFPAVLGNEAMLTQVLSNLMGNGVKFVQPGVRPRLRVWCETRGKAVRLNVEDNGIGIAPDQHEKIFGMFQRVSKSFEGTGIGLAIVKKAVERMGGSVGLMSELDKGSTFWVEIQSA